MALRKQPRSIARELALLSISQITTKKNQLSAENLDDLISAAIRTLIVEVQDNLEAASAEIKRGEERILSSETKTTELNAARAMVQEAIVLSQTAINRLGMAIEFPEFLQLTSREQVRQYAAELIVTVNDRTDEIGKSLESVLVAWQLSRIAQVDRDILRIAVAEILYLEIPDRVAINESVELAKRYSDEDGFRFINGVLRRLSDRIKEQGIDAIVADSAKAEVEAEVKTEAEAQTNTSVSQTSETSETATAQTAPQKVIKSIPIIKQTKSDRD